MPDTYRAPGETGIDPGVTRDRSSPANLRTAMVCAVHLRWRSSAFPESAHTAEATQEYPAGHAMLSRAELSNAAK